MAEAHSLGIARALVEKIRAGEAEYHFIEVMTCPGGCIGGGGLPRITTDAVRETRIKAIYAEGEGKTLRKSHEHPNLAGSMKSLSASPLAIYRTSFST